MPTFRSTRLFNIQLPIIQGGMVWCSGWQLAAAVSEAGGLGLIGSGSMHPPTLREHIVKCKAVTDCPFGVNIPLLYPEVEKIIEIVIEEQVPIVFTSAGNPAIWTQRLKQAGIIVVHVVSSARFAQKSEAAGVDAVVAEGFEAGGHNGREETTTFCLVPLVREAVSIPVFAAGGIGSGAAMLAAEALGAEGFQMGSVFAATKESSAHDHFKDEIIRAGEGHTQLVLKELAPVRLIKNGFFDCVRKAEGEGATREQLAQLLGKGRAKKGMFEGDLAEGELEIGQVAAGIKEIYPAGELVRKLWKEYLEAKLKL